MESCCAAPLAADSRPRRCAECGHAGRSVEVITLKALLRSPALGRLGGGAHRFCATPSCRIVYFSESAEFRAEDIVVPVFQKVPEGVRTVCYCLEITEDQIRREVETAGRSTAAERIKAFVQSDRCACEVRNPQGTCCLGNVAAVIRSAQGVCVT